MIIGYSTKQKISKYMDAKDCHFFDDFFGINFIIKGNDYSCISMSLLNFFFNVTKQDNIYFEIKKNFLKKEIIFFYREKIQLNKFWKKFKNFNIWHHLNWLSIKEKNAKTICTAKNVRNIISIDSKNIHAWKYFLKYLSLKTSICWKILIIIEILETIDKINNSIINAKRIFFFFSKIISRSFYNIYIKIFSNKTLSRDNNLYSFLKFLKIKNSRNFFLLNILKT